MATLFTATSPSHHRFVSPSQHPKQNLPSQPLSVAFTANPAPAAVALQQQHQMTDWVAPPVTRRFGIGAGFAWAAFLAYETVSEQMKSPLVVFQGGYNTRVLEKQEEIVLPNGIRYYDLQVGSGATPSSGYLVVFDVKGQVHGTEQVFVDTFGSKDKKKKSLAMVMDSRPYSKGLCQGIEYVLRSMKAGGKRRVIIPPSLGFGDKNVEFGPGLQIPPSATLDYTIEAVWVWTVSLPLTVVNASDGGGSLKSTDKTEENGAMLVCGGIQDIQTTLVRYYCGGESLRLHLILLPRGVYGNLPGWWQGSLSLGASILQPKSP